MFNKKKTHMDKENETYTTNDGYIISTYFCNPLQVRKELNSAN